MQAGRRRRLREATAAVAVLQGRVSRKEIQAWFQGMNPVLDDVAPARMLREREPAEAGCLGCGVCVHGIRPRKDDSIPGAQLTGCLP